MTGTGFAELGGFGFGGAVPVDAVGSVDRNDAAMRASNAASLTPLAVTLGLGSGGADEAASPAVGGAGTCGRFFSWEPDSDPLKYMSNKNMIKAKFSCSYC